MPTSSEFVALCRAQVALLTQALGASLSIVYLTQELVEGADAQLVPVVAHPDVAVDWQPQGRPRSPLLEWGDAELSPRLLASGALAPSPPPSAELPESTAPTGRQSHDWVDVSNEATPPDPSLALTPQRQIVLPLMHENVVLGLLVTERNDRGWTEWEQSQIQQIADTLAIACVLDQRYQWLEADRQQQRQLQAQQHDMLDNLLHQFRNSLTALQTFGKLIVKRLLPGDTSREWADGILRETVRLRELSQQLENAVADADPPDVSLLSLPPAVGAEPEPSPSTGGAATVPLLPGKGFLSSAPLLLEPCSVIAILTPLLTSASAIAQERQQILATDIPADLPLVQTNPSALREVLSNLIDNALKYSPQGGRIWMQCRLDDDTSPLPIAFKPIDQTTGRNWLTISVTDTGPGIPPEDLPHIFERRYRGVQAQTDIPGSGLGLAISQALVRQMQGEIAVFSPAAIGGVSNAGQPVAAQDGPGTTVVVRLPIATAVSRSA